MCSVIEIKNNDEYYIRYHSPDSMVENSITDKKEKQSEHTTSIIKQEATHSGSDDGTNTTSGDSGHQRDILSNSPKSQIEEHIMNEFPNTRQNKNEDHSFDIIRDGKINKDADVTSDRGSSEESIMDGKEKVNTSFPEFSAAKHVSSKNQTKYHHASNNNNNRGASIEKVPITINSHIPASPERLLSQKTLTHDTGTQIENIEENTNNASKSPEKVAQHVSTFSKNANGRSKWTDQDNVKDAKLKQNLVMRLDENADNNQEKRQETNLQKQEMEIKNDNLDLQRNVDANSRYFLGQTKSNGNASETQQLSSSEEGKRKKSFLCRSSTNNQVKGASVLPMQLEEKNGSAILKQSNIPILIKKEVSPKRKLSSLIGSSKCTADGKDKGIKKENKKGKTNTGSTLEENTHKENNSSRKGSIKANAHDKQKKESNDKKEVTKSSKISPIVALSNQCKSGFGIRKNKNPDTNHDKINDKNYHKKNRSTNEKIENVGMNDKTLVKKSYSMDSIGDIYKSIPSNEPGLRKDQNQGLHYSQNQIDIPKSSFFEQHPHAVLKAAKTKDGYTVYGSGKKWTLDSGK